MSTIIIIFILNIYNMYKFTYNYEDTIRIINKIITKSTESRGILKCQKNSFKGKNRDVSGSRAEAGDGATGGDREAKWEGKGAMASKRDWGATWPEVSRDPRGHMGQGGARDPVSQLSGAFTATTSFELHGHPDEQVRQTQLSSNG